jgi:hypothetical protein
LKKEYAKRIVELGKEEKKEKKGAKKKKATRKADR